MECLEEQQVPLPEFIEYATTNFDISAETIKQIVKNPHMDISVNTTHILSTALFVYHDDLITWE